jgi:hypothetical protein
MAESSTLIQHHAQFSDMKPEFADKSIENGLKKGNCKAERNGGAPNERSSERNEAETNIPGCQ